MKEKIMNKLKEVGRQIKEHVTDPTWWLDILGHVFWTIFVSTVSYIVGTIAGAVTVYKTTHVSDEDIAKGDKIDMFYDAADDTVHCKRTPKD